MLLVRIHMCIVVLFPGVEDEMALALELSRREGQPHPSPQKPPIQNRPPGESERSRSTQRSFSSTPFYHYGGVTGSSEDDEDEDLQMALACSLSEIEAQQRAAAPDFISGAGGGVRAMFDISGGHRGGGVVTAKNLNAAVSEKVVAEGKEERGHFKVDSGPGDRWGTEGKGTREPSLSPDSSTTDNTTPLSQCSEGEFEPAAHSSDGSVKKKNKCGCTVC